MDIMEYAGQNRLELFAENALGIKKEFVWQNDLTKRMAALLYAQEGREMDCAAIQRCHALIKKNTGVFSAFRGDMALCVAALLSLSADPETVFIETLKVYDLLKAAKFYASDFLVVAAYQIAAQSKPSDYENVVARARGFYDGMKADHFFYTGQDDYVFAAMLALSDLDVPTGAERIERLYARLKDEFWDRNSVQTLAQVLVLSDSDDSIVQRVLDLRDAMRAQKIKLDKTYTLPILGILALLPVEIDTLVHDLDAARDALQEKKWFGPLSLTTQTLLLFAASVVAGDYAQNVKDGALVATLSTSVSNIILAQHAAMIAMVSASTAAAASASS